MSKHKLKKHIELLYSKKFLITFGIIFFAITIWEFTYFSFIHNDEDYTVNFNDSSKIISIHIPKNLNFAGEKVPTTNFKTRKSIEKEIIASTYWKSQSLLLHKRANRWFPIIEPILKQNNIPDDFKYIALIESQLTNAISPKGATGFWQFVEPTAKGYNLEITEDVDERYSVIKSTYAACKYFKEAHKLFNNWTLVAASYNRGIGGIQTQLNKQNKNEYYDLLLTKETSRYIFRLLAMKEIISRPKVYGYEITKKNRFPSPITKKTTIDSTIHDLTFFAAQQGTEIRFLKAVNPWLRSNKLMNSENKKYILEIPKNNNFIYDYDGNYIELKVTIDSIQPVQAMDTVKNNIPH